jgi:hypothetical protein
VHCNGKVPCFFPNSTYIKGGTFLFNVESDPYEEHEVSAQNPAVVAQLMKRLQVFLDKKIPQENYPTDPRSNPKNFGGVWTPWEGDPNPEKCDKPDPPPPPQLMSSLDGVSITPAACMISGWCSGPGYSGPSLEVRVLIDGKKVANATASVHRKIAGDHGFAIPLDCAMLEANKKHKIEADAMFQGSWWELKRSPVCIANSKPVPC